MSVEGKRHDSRMLAESNLLQNLENHAFSPTGEPMCLYGDPAYPLRLQLQAPFREVQLTTEMVAYNKSMSSVRVSVEWIFGDIVNYFKFMDFEEKILEKFEDWPQSNRQDVYSCCYFKECINMSLW